MARKTIAITATIAVTLYLAYSAVFAAAASTEINQCCNLSAENQVYPYTAPCCMEDENGSDCCYDEIPPQEDGFLFFGFLDRGSYHNDMCVLQTRVFDSFIYSELPAIVGDEQLTPKNVIYFIFRPPKV